MGLCAYNISKEGPPKSRGNKSTLFSPTSSYTYIFFLLHVSLFCAVLSLSRYCISGMMASLIPVVGSWQLLFICFLSPYSLLTIWFSTRKDWSDSVSLDTNPKFLGVDKSHINHINANIIPSFLFRFVVLVSPPDFYLLFPSGQLFFVPSAACRSQELIWFHESRKKAH